MWKKVWIITAPYTKADIMGIGDAHDCAQASNYWTGTKWSDQLEDSEQYASEGAAEAEFNSIKAEQLETTFFIEIKPIYVKQ